LTSSGDEPSFTQPRLYQTIKSHPSTREVYGRKLLEEKILSEAELNVECEKVMLLLEEAKKSASLEMQYPAHSVFEGAWKGFRQPKSEDLLLPTQTAVSSETLRTLAQKINKIPENFHLHPKLGRFFEARLKAVEEGQGLDWGNGETLAFATLLNEGVPVRISGQDVERGTFTHRHSVLHDVESDALYVPLNHLAPKQAYYQAYNSSLSEAAVLGFEHGYALASPKTLVIWEAQFGDFAKGAQVIIDQFIASTESKWQRMAGLVLLLPHGYEGQGPEHSSARIERFLNLSGKNNWSICYLSTPAQLFHALRRQMKREFRKPLVVMTPKSLLRHPLAVSALSDFTDKNFEEILEDVSIETKTLIRKILLCSGKVYYDLVTERTARSLKDIAILRLEQIYPWATGKIKNILAPYSNAKEIFWVQEEPRNMGAWSYVFNLWMGGSGDFQKEVGGKTIRYIGREEGAAPAVGYARVHEAEQKKIIDQALS
jgi:2-oxoglutarate dehydrogenase E1 component